jgi:hypothetical protein
MKQKKSQNTKSIFPKNYSFPLVDFYSACPFTMDQIIEQTRLSEIVQWRQIYSFYLYSVGYSKTKIGQITNQDHSTIVYAVKIVNNALNGYNPKLLEKIKSILKVSESIFQPTDDIYFNEILSLRYLEHKIQQKFNKL